MTDHFTCLCISELLSRNVPFEELVAFEDYITAAAASQVWYDPIDYLGTHKAFLARKGEIDSHVVTLVSDDHAASFVFGDNMIVQGGLVVYPRREGEDKGAFMLRMEAAHRNHILDTLNNESMNVNAGQEV